MGVPSEIKHIFSENPAQKIAVSNKVEDPSDPGAMEVKTLRYSMNPATGEGRMMTTVEKPRFKKICFYVGSAVQGQIGTIVRQLAPESTALAARPDSVGLQTNLRTLYANAVRTRRLGQILGTASDARFVVTEYQLSLDGNACVDLPFDSGEVEITWFEYGSPNPEALRRPPPRRPDGSMPWQKVQYQPPYLGTDPNAIERSAKVIHTTVVDLGQNAVRNDEEF